MLSRRSFIAALAAALAVPLTTDAEAHPGALNSAGCHRERRTGRRHCHAGAGRGRRFVGWGGGVYRRSRRRRR